MEDLRLAIIVLGVFSILGITVHGLWTIRKNVGEQEATERGEKKEPTLTPTDPPASAAQVDAALVDGPTSKEPVGDGPSKANDSGLGTDGRDDQILAPHLVADAEIAAAGYDDDGIGTVRTLGEQPQSSTAPAVAPLPDTADVSAVVANTAAAAETDFPDPPPSLLCDNPHAQQTAVANPDKPSFAQRAKHLVTGGKRVTTVRAKPASKSEPRVEPSMTESHKAAGSAAQAAANPGISESAQPLPVEPQEIVVLNVKVPDGKVIQGVRLLPELLTLGFKYGEQEVFHRHTASDGRGPKLFSLANMYKPGCFDLDEMELFETPGISLFMILPIVGDPLQVFNMMHNAARKLADEFGGQVLDSRRRELTKRGVQQHMEKIREFERRRALNRATPQV